LRFATCGLRFPDLMSSPSSVGVRWIGEGELTDIRLAQVPVICAHNTDSFVASLSFSGDDVFYAGWNDDGFASPSLASKRMTRSPKCRLCIRRTRVNVGVAVAADFRQLARPLPPHPTLQPASGRLTR